MAWKGGIGKAAVSPPRWPAVDQSASFSMFSATLDENAKPRCALGEKSRIGRFVSATV
jgi:hypothetical protein